MGTVVHGRLANRRHTTNAHQLADSGCRAATFASTRRKSVLSWPPAARGATRAALRRPIRLSRGFARRRLRAEMSGTKRRVEHRASAVSRLRVDHKGWPGGIPPAQGVAMTCLFGRSISSRPFEHILHRDILDDLSKRYLRASFAPGPRPGPIVELNVKPSSQKRPEHVLYVI